VFDKLHADLGKALLSIPACKGFEVGSGFAGTRLHGSEHNDIFYAEGGRIRTRSNRSGGIQGGISNGEDIIVRAAFKPVATILREQETVDLDGNPRFSSPAAVTTPACFARGAHRRSHDGPGAGRPLPAPAGARLAISHREPRGRRRKKSRTDGTRPFLLSSASLPLRSL